MLTGVKVIDICPVGDYHTVPIEAFLEPASKKLVVGVRRNTVDGCRIDHNGESTSLLEWSEVLLSQIIWGNVRRCAVLARTGSSVTKVMLDADCSMLLVNMVGVRSLNSLRFSSGHN